METNHASIINSLSV